MEVETKIPWLDPKHPNYDRWKRSRKLAIDRGKFVKSVIEQHIGCNQLKILDFGSGEGGTTAVFSADNFVISLDISLVRLQRQTKLGSNLSRVNGDALLAPFHAQSFDLIILQDVIEHLSNSEEIILALHKLLNRDGIVYLSTPNKYSIFNLIADPHWGLPVVSILKRKTIKKYFLKNFRQKDYNRTDIAQLLTLKQLASLFAGKFEWQLNTVYSLKQLLAGNKGIVWSSFHLILLSVIKKLKLDKIILKIANDKSGIINRYFNPTFYFILKKV